MMTGKAVVHSFSLLYSIKPQLIPCNFDEYLGSFLFVAVLNNVYVNILVLVS